MQSGPCKLGVRGLARSLYSKECVWVLVTLVIVTQTVSGADPADIFDKQLAAARKVENLGKKLDARPEPVMPHNNDAGGTRIVPPGDEVAKPNTENEPSATASVYTGTPPTQVSCLRLMSAKPYRLSFTSFLAGSVCCPNILNEGVCIAL